jgi:hypothetical protein
MWENSELDGKIHEGDKQKRSERNPSQGQFVYHKSESIELEAPLPVAMKEPIIRNTKLSMLRPTYTTAKKDKTHTTYSQVLKS